MQNLSERIESLIKLARQIVEAKTDYTSQIESYSDTMEGLEQELKIGLSSEIKPKLKELSDLHNLVMERVEKQKSRIKADIMSLKKKGKIVIRYTDHMPKSISLKARRKV